MVWKLKLHYRIQKSPTPVKSSPCNHSVVYPLDMDLGDGLLKGVSCTIGSRQRIVLQFGFERGGINPSPLGMNVIEILFWAPLLLLLFLVVIVVVPVPVATRRSAAARLLRLWVRIPQTAWMFFCCECCVLSDRGLCDELITLPEESYRLWCTVVCDLETS